MKPALLAFNRGRVSRLALARIDLKRMSLSSEVQTNWMPRVLGSMMLRPGMAYLGSTKSDAAAVFLPFIFSTTDVALIEITNLVMRVWVSDALVTRGSVSSAVTNGNFDTDVASWTDSDEAGATSIWATGGYLSLAGNGTNAARRRQQVTVAVGDQNDEHALRIVIQRGPVTLKVGSSAGADDYINETSLGTGTHSLTFTPTGDFHIELSNRRIPVSLVDSINVEASGVMEVTAPWATADLSKIRYRYSQSGDIIFVGADGYQQRKIERRSTRSWSVVLYEPEDGPFRVENTTTTTLTATAITGDTTLTASTPLFRSSHVGALFRLTSQGQTVTSSISAENTFTNSIEVTGTSTARSFSVSRSGTWVATVTLQRSFDDGSSWIDVATYTTNAAVTFTDGLDNQIVLYRIGVKTGDYTSGTAVLTLSYPLGTITGVAKVTAFTSSTSVSVAVLSDLGSTSATEVWAEGEWSTYRGFPTCGAFYEGRLWWAGRDKIQGSISDAFDGFDPDFPGDAGVINRTIGSGPVDRINWLLPMQRLLAGTDGAEISIRSSSFDEPLTPSNFNAKDASTQGSAAVEGLKVDARGIFLQRNAIRLYELATSAESNDYSPIDLTALIPEIGEPSIIRMAVQRKPDTRIHCVRSDGTVAVCIFDRTENVLCWIDVETDGLVEDVVVLPGTTEDALYYVVNRTINSSTKRYLEKWALESECVGGTLNKQLDSFILYSGASTTTITGLTHLEGETVAVWGNGLYLGTYVVASAQITGITTAVTSAVVGLPYTATYKSTKLAYIGKDGSTSLLDRKKISKFGVILADTHADGLEFGPDFTTMDPLPKTEDYAAVSQTAIHESYDHDRITFPGSWSTDSRLCLRATAPKPCTVLAAVMELETS